MKHLFFLLACWLPQSLLHAQGTTTATDYEFYFGTDYTTAIQYCGDNQHWFWAAGKVADVEPELLNAVLFPELVRYSLLQDFLETKVMEQLYTTSGTLYADFSIGTFQMKPSFAEQMEAEIGKKETWAMPFQQVIVFQSSNAQDVRAERIARLKQTHWQLVYAAALCSLVKHRFGDTPEYQQLGAVRFTAAAYNGGFNKSAASIQKTAAMRQFPYGKNESADYQHAYADIAFDFYQRYTPKIYSIWK